jgi:hypothetical protein
MQANNMRYAASILEAFNIDYAVVFDTEDNHNLAGVPVEKLLGTKKGEFEDGLMEVAKPFHILLALIEADNALQNQERALGLSGQISEFKGAKDLEDIVEILTTSKISDASEVILKKNIKSWLNDSKRFILGKLIAQNTEGDEIPQYILDMFEFVRKQIDSKEVGNAG